MKTALGACLNCLVTLWRITEPPIALETTKPTLGEIRFGSLLK